jgi:chromosome segregation ATPase
LKDNKDKLELELFEIGETNMKEKNELGLQLFEAQNKKNDIEMKSNLVASRLEELKNEKQEIEDELRAKMEGEKESMRAQINGYQAKLHDSDALKRKIEKELIIAKSESEKDMALLTQKVGFLEKQQQIHDKKEKELQDECSILKKNTTGQVKELTNRYESQISNQQGELLLLNEKVGELQGETEKKESQTFALIQGLESQLATIQAVIQEKDNQLEAYQGADDDGKVMLAALDLSD